MKSQDTYLSEKGDKHGNWNENGYMRSSGDDNSPTATSLTTDF
ncbi:hypothetical protein [Fibrobacter sp.]